MTTYTDIGSSDVNDIQIRKYVGHSLYYSECLCYYSPKNKVFYWH